MTSCYFVHCVYIVCWLKLLLMLMVLVPRITIFDVVVFEDIGNVTIPLNRTGGDLSRNSVIRATSRDGTAQGECCS